MVQLTFDTKGDSLEELEEALRILQDAIVRRKGAPTVQPAPAQEEAIETPFMKISFSSDDAPSEQAPTLNQLIEDSSLTQEEMSKMFKQVEAEDAPKKKPKKEASDATFIEIVEFDDADEKEK
jgi:hypothetical protein